MTPLIDDFTDPTRASNGATWALLSDGVMGGVSVGALRPVEMASRRALRLTGTVSLENNGGFVQMALDLASDGSAVDASGYSGLSLTVAGDGGDYGVHLRTTDVRRPWQSYRATISTSASWQTFWIPFGTFVPHRIEAPLDPARLRRIGIIAIGRPGPVEIAVADLRFY